MFVKPQFNYLPSLSHVCYNSQPPYLPLPPRVDTESSKCLHNTKWQEAIDVRQTHKAVKMYGRKKHLNKVNGSRYNRGGCHIILHSQHLWCHTTATQVWRRLPCSHHSLRQPPTFLGWHHHRQACIVLLLPSPPSSPSWPWLLQKPFGVTGGQKHLHRQIRTRHALHECPIVSFPGTQVAKQTPKACLCMEREIAVWQPRNMNMLFSLHLLICIY